MKIFKLFLILTMFFSLQVFAKPTKIALINNQVQKFDFFNLANEAIQAGARIIILPEWGFYRQNDTAPETLMKWEEFARTNEAYIFLNVRYESSNATFVFGPKGKITHYFRRDGHFTKPRPDEPSQIINTEYGIFGILACDEIFISKLVDQYRSVKVNAIINPAQTIIYDSAKLGEESLQSMKLPADVFTTDRYTRRGDGGGEFSISTQKLTRNMFGVDRPLDVYSNCNDIYDLNCLFWMNSKTIPDTEDHYYISYHDINYPESTVSSVEKVYSRNISEKDLVPRFSRQ